MALFQSGTYNLAAVADQATFRWGVAMLPVGPKGRVSVTNGIAAAGNSATNIPTRCGRCWPGWAAPAATNISARGGAAIPAVLAAQPVYDRYWRSRGVDVGPFFKVLNGPRIAAPGRRRIRRRVRRAQTVLRRDVPGPARRREQPGRRPAGRELGSATVGLFRRLSTLHSGDDVRILAMSTYVLVHGAFGGGWVWDDVAERLASDGHHLTSSIDCQARAQTGLPRRLDGRRRHGRMVLDESNEAASPGRAFLQRDGDRRTGRPSERASQRLPLRLMAGAWAVGTELDGRRAFDGVRSLPRYDGSRCRSSNDFGLSQSGRSAPIWTGPMLTDDLALRYCSRCM